MKNKILFLILGMFMISFASAWSNSTFNNSLSSENLTFIQEYCYQESANTSDQTGIDGSCGLNYSGNYLFLSDWSWTNPENVIDGDWNTYGGFFGFDGGTYYINYSKPNRIFNGSLWRVKTNLLGEKNYSLSECFGAYNDKLVLKIRIYASGDGIPPKYTYIYCYNSTDWITLDSYSGGSGVSYIYEEAMQWWDSYFKRWLSVPEDVYVINAYMNLSGYENSTNITLEGLYCNGIITDCENANDQNWSTRTTTATSNNYGYIFMNYTLQGWENMNYFKYKFYINPGGGTPQVTFLCYNYTLGDYSSLYTYTTPGNIITTTTEVPEVCIDSNLIQLKIITKSGGGTAGLYEIEHIGNGSATINPHIQINNTQIWNHSGKFNSTEKTSNFAATINSYLSGCSIVNGFCLIPFLFNTDTVGILEYLAMIFNNEGFLENSQTYSNETTEGNIEAFKINLTYDSIEYSIIEAKLIYNETEYFGIKSGSGNNVIFNANVPVPSVSANENKTFYWNILVGSSYYNSTFNNQTIYNLEIDNCTSYSNTILNMTIYDEEDQNLLNGTGLQVAVNIYSNNRETLVLNLSGDYSNNPTSICLNRNLSESSVYLMDATIRYTSVGYAIEYYNLVNLTLDNESSTENLILYDLNATDSTEFQLTFKGKDALPEENALIFVERQYIAENTFKTVELPKTDSNGQTVLHLVRNDVIYNIRVIKDGEVLGNFLNIIAFCQDYTIGSCAISLNALTNETGIFNYDDEVGILYDSPPTYSTTTNRVSFDFTSTDGSVKTILMNVERKDIFGNQSICDNTIISTSGTVSCDIGLNLTETSLETTISVDGEELIVDTIVIDNTAYGSIGYAVWFILAIGLALMFSESKNGILLSLAISYIGAVSMGLIVGGITGIGSAGIWVLIMTSIGIWKLNKNRKS